MGTLFASGLVPHPGLVLLVGAVLLPLLRGRLRSALALALPLLALAALALLPDGEPWQLAYLGQVLTPLRLDALSRLVAGAFVLVAFTGTLFALRSPSRLELPAAGAYAGAALLVVLAGDWLTLFIGWELMAIASTLLLWSAGGPAAQAAAGRYLMVHLLGGVLLLAGIGGLVAGGGSLAIGPLWPAGAGGMAGLAGGAGTAVAANTGLWPAQPAAVLILAGLLVNAAAPPLWSWVADAYPEASPGGAVFLSAFTTKAAIVLLLRCFAGLPLLAALGVAMLVYGVLYAALAQDIRRTLAHALVSQLGVMLIVIAAGGPQAAGAVAALAVSGIAYTALLMMVAGVVLQQTGQRRLAALGGLRASMPFTAACAAVGALALAGWPLGAGFVAKGLAADALAASPLRHLGWLLTGAGAAAMLHAGLAWPWRLFASADRGQRPPEAPSHQRLAMALLVLACIAPGLWPALLLDRLPAAVNTAAGAVANTAAGPAALTPTAPSLMAALTQVLVLLAGAALYALLRRPLARGVAHLLDLDWLWRRPLATWADTALRRGSEVSEALSRQLDRRFNQPWRQALQAGRAGGSPATRGMAVWVLLLMLGYLVVYFT